MNRHPPASSHFELHPQLAEDTVPVIAALTALLVVEVTLFDIVTSGVQRVVSVVAGVLLAVGFSALVGLSWWSLCVLVAMAILVGHLLRLGPQLGAVRLSAMPVAAAGGRATAGRPRWASGSPPPTPWDPATRRRGR